MSEPIDFQPYLYTIRQHYEHWWEYYTVIDAQGRERLKAPVRERQTQQASEKPASPFDFGLMVQTVTRDDERRTPNPKNPEEPKEKIERFPVLEGLRKYAFDEKTRQLLLVGRPGSGKSTALARLLLEEATLTPNPSPNSGRGELKVIPVLVELRYWQTSIAALMLDFFGQYGLSLSETELENLLAAKRLLVLMDGVNELPSEEARSQLAAFRRKYPRVPAIFTTRDLSIGGDVGIEKKLEMQPLTEAQMQAFVRAYLPDRGEAMLRQLQGRLQELLREFKGKPWQLTPLLLWMLCEVVQWSPKAQLPNNLGGIFQAFTCSYEESSVRNHEVAVRKGDVRPLSDRRLWCKALKHLAWVMMRGENPIDLRVVIQRGTAERELEKLFHQELSPPKISRDCLDDLLKYHLLQIKTGDEIEFRHQLIQEYYAAEALRERLPDLSDGELKREYLNYLNWTVPVALMLALVRDEAQALRVVRLAVEVDWMLGARLAGEVKQEFQEQTVEMVSGLNVPLWLKVELWGKTRSDFVLPGLFQALEDEDLRQRTVVALGNLGAEEVIEALLWALEDEDSYVRSSAVEALKNLGAEAEPDLLQSLEDENAKSAEALGNLVEDLGKLGKEEAATQKFYMTLDDRGSWARWRAIVVSGQPGSETAIPRLLQALEDENPSVRSSTAQALGQLGSKAAIPILLQALEDLEDRWASRSAAEGLGSFKKDRAAHILPNLLTLIPTKSGSDAFRALTAIQANCKFYNYDIFRSPPIPKAETEHPPGQTKIYKIDKLGILNTGDVTNHGDQIGIQNPIDPNTPPGGI